MESVSRAISPGRLWAGRIVGGLVVLFLLFDTMMKLLRLPQAMEGTVQLGYPENSVLVIGIIQLACLVLYLIPRTSILGAILLTGYLGGAVATHVRIESPLFTHILFPIYVGLFIWGALVLRNDRLRTLLFQEG
ncbi:MAG TPA: DoxX family protein [Gemmatimonadales bacterium]|nr:DoxX family protein [Gemmatimonadales bacterium]